MTLSELLAFEDVYTIEIATLARFIGKDAPEVQRKLDEFKVKYIQGLADVVRRGELRKYAEQFHIPVDDTMSDVDVLHHIRDAMLGKPPRYERHRETYDDPQLITMNRRHRRPLPWFWLFVVGFYALMTALLVMSRGM